MFPCLHSAFFLHNFAPFRAQFAPQITQCVPYPLLFNPFLLNITVMKKTRTMFGFGALLLVAGSLALSISSASAKGNQDKTKTDISSSANPSTYGQWVTLTATVTPASVGSGTPTGTVTFKQGNNILAIAALDKLGQAAFSTNVFSAAGSSTHPISADYSGDSNFKGSSANAFKQEITPAILTVSGITAKSKSYDATTSATLDASSATLVGVVGKDKVTLDASGAKGAFANKNAGKNKTVSLSGIAISGADASQYTLVLSSAAADIIPATLTVTADNLSRTSGTANPPLTANYSGFVNGETLATSDVTGNPSLVTGATTNSAAGSYPIITGAGTLASVNYNFVFANGTLNVTASDKTSVQNISIASLQPQSNGGMKLTLSGNPGQTYVLEASTDLVHWTAISTNVTDSNGLSTFVDSDAKNYPSRFYRGVVLAQQ